MGGWVRLMHRLFPLEAPNSDHYHRSRETARELTVDRIRVCRHHDDLARVAQMLVGARSGWLYGLDRAFTRAERGELLVEVRYRRCLLAMERDKVKVRGPRLDPTRLPMAALERLIQHHEDRDLADLLRGERQRRMSVARWHEPARACG
jgi:hypothetical protein